MQLQLPSLHLLLTCSFVLLLAYLLSTIFSYFASSVLGHGRSSSTASRRRHTTHTPARSPRRPPSVQIEPAQQSVEAAGMDQLPEEDEDDQDLIMDHAGTPAALAVTAIPRTLVGSDVADSIFYDGPMEIRSDECSRQGYDGITEEDVQKRQKLKQVARGVVGASRRRENEGGEICNGDFDAADSKEKLNGDAELKKVENELRWDNRGLEEIANEEDRNNLGGGDVPGSMSSPSQQRLPPTWSDLEKLVNTNFKKDWPAPAEPTLSEEY
ncbi:hypothetical protein L7F22_054850 [Adiantum nelumboides]|nr:hypothetical protein [Adiantum nelumboides]